MLNEKEMLLQLSQHRELVFNLLNNLPINSINISNNKVRFDTIEHNSHAYSLDLETLYYYNFRDGKKGNLIDLMSDLLKEDRNSILYTLYISLCLKGDILDFNSETVSNEYEYKLEFPESYDDDALKDYPNVISDLFLKDNIWITSQIHWGIKYDNRYKRIIIPVYQDEGLVGAIGRLNKSKIEDYENKYMPILTYSKSKVLFGLDTYKDKIKQIKKVIIVESEKSVIKAWQYRSKIPVVAIGCSSISRTHIERLNLLGVDEIILALDKSIEDENVLKNDLNKLNKYSNAKIIKFLDIDKCEDVGEKMCIFDLTDTKKIREIFKKHLVVYKNGGKDDKGTISDIQ